MVVCSSTVLPHDSRDGAFHHCSFLRSHSAVEFMLTNRASFRRMTCTNEGQRRPTVVVRDNASPTSFANATSDADDDLPGDTLLLLPTYIAAASARSSDGDDHNDNGNDNDAEAVFSAEQEDREEEEEEEDAEVGEGDHAGRLYFTFPNTARAGTATTTRATVGTANSSAADKDDFNSAGAGAAVKPVFQITEV